MAEELGLDSLWVAEGWGSDGLMMAASLGAVIEKIKPVPGVLNILSSDRNEARKRARRDIAQCTCAMGPYYSKQLSSPGCEREVASIREALGREKG